MNIFVLEAGQSPLDLFPCGSAGTFVYSRSSPSSRWPEICKTLRRLDNESFDLAVVSYREKSFFPKGAGWMRGLGQALRSFLFRPDELAQLLMFSKLVQKNIPIALINRSDCGRLLPGSEWYYRRAHRCFVRELHPVPEIALKDIFTASGGNLQSNRRARRILSLFDPSSPKIREISKLMPISLGLPEATNLDFPSPSEKKWDLFFAGDLNEKSIRQRLALEARAFAEKHRCNFLICDRMNPAEYHKALTESHLCLSPPGMGWDCFRHYEAMLAGSVPLMTYPTILQYQAPIHGEHCFYFAPEPGGLTRSLEHALSLKAQLPQMAEAGRQLILEHHTFPKLREYVIHETLKAFSHAHH